MPEDVADRIPPQVIQVPPPKSGPNHIGWSLALLIVLVPLALLSPAAWLRLNVMLAICVVVAVFIFWRQRIRRFNQRRAAWIERHEDWCSDPQAMALGRRWDSLAHPPSLEGIQDALRDYGSPPADRALIVACGAYELPPTGDHRGEPTLLTPRESAGSLSIALFVFLGVLLMGMLVDFHERVPETLARWWPTLAIMTALTAGAFGHHIVRPRYLRVAPGVAQVITYSILRSRPDIRSYPMSVETTVLATETLNTMTLKLVRGEQTDTIQLWRSDSAERFLEKLWLALLSTTPTPPLSNEELVG